MSYYLHISFDEYRRLSMSDREDLRDALNDMIDDLKGSSEEPSK